MVQGHLQYILTTPEVKPHRAGRIGSAGSQGQSVGTCVDVIELANPTDGSRTRMADGNKDHGLLRMEEAVVRERRVHALILARAGEDAVSKR